MKYSYNLVLLFLTVLCACNNDNEADVDLSVPADIEIGQYRTLDLSNYSFDFANMFDYGISEYGLEPICGCTCENVLEFREFFNDAIVYLPAMYHDLPLSDAECDVLRTKYRSHCQFTSYVEFKESTFALLGSGGPNLTTEEISLLNSMISDIENGVFDKIQIRDQWNDLSTTSELNNGFSLVVIETTIALSEYRNANPQIFDEMPDPLDGTSEWVWKPIAILASASYSVIAECIWDTVSDTGYCDDGPGDIIRTAVIGAAVGAIT